MKIRTFKYSLIKFYDRVETELQKIMLDVTKFTQILKQF